MSQGPSEIFVSVIAPMRDDAPWIAAFIEQVEGVLQSHYAEFEIVLVDDGSTDGTVKIVESLLTKFRCIRLLRLSRPMGVEIAITAGLETAIGDYVVTMLPAADPVELIPRIVDLARDGSDVVVGVDDSMHDRGLVFRSLRGVFYGLCHRLIDAEMVAGATCFRVLSRQAVNAMTRVRSRRRYFSLLAFDIGFDSTCFRYEQQPRGPVRKLGLLASMRAGISLLVHNSTSPLRLVSVMGLAGSLLSLLYAVYVLAINLFAKTIAPGWTTLSLQTTGLLFMVFLMLTFIGEYLVRLLEEVSDRPLYYVHAEKTSSIMLARPDRTNVMQSAASPDRIVPSPTEPGPHD